MSRILVLFVFSFVILAGCQNHMSELGKQTTPKDHLSHLKNKGTAKPTVNTISSKNWSNAAEQVQRARVIQALKDQQLPLPTNDYLINIVQNVGVVLKNYDSSADLNTIIVNTYNDLSSFNQKTNLVTQDPFTNKKNEGDVNVKLLSVVNNGKSTSFIYEDDQLHPSIYMSKETNGKWVFKDKLLISKSEDVVTMGLIIYQLAADESKGTYTIFAMTYDENGNLTDKEPLPVTFKAENPDMAGVLPDPAVHPVNTDQGQGVLIT
ncbi:MAG TPA: hypothetical protein VLK78_05295, partial [Candidatus Angelobacter sp.]|nr:hypothetical protein [Candidatus Angelobacter sp.]